MGLESGSFISALVSSNPVGASDPKSQGDDHLRFIKAKLLETFPNITGAVTASHTELNLVTGATGGLATLSVSFAALQTLVNTMATLSFSLSTSDITGTLRSPLIRTVTADKLQSGTLTSSVGYAATVFANGTYSTTLTLNPLFGNLQSLQNGGGTLTIIPPTVNTSMVVQVTNTPSATVAVTSSFTKVSGAFTNTNGDDFMCYVTRIGSFSHLTIVALQ